jgi:hypothetical protein
MENSNITTLDEYERNIEYMKINIKHGGLVKINEDTINDIVTMLFTFKDVSTFYLHSYEEFIGFLEIYETQYKDKYTDLINYILKNMKEDDKKLLPCDEYGTPMLLTRPMLERSYNTMYIRNIVNEDIYKLITSIKSNMKNIVQFENQYLQSDANGTNDTNDTNGTNGTKGTKGTKGTNDTNDTSFICS